ncbi:MAG: glutamate racemase [Acidobacteriota bacterium]|nr:glutamate racemase [Acidobacteriota bacterium]
MTSSPSPNLTIGVFDSGFGGLTVLRALLPLVPAAHYIYLGDTARLPYGSKSRETIARYAVSSAQFLHQQGAELLVVACNTATALALEDIQQALPIPVIGVVDPGAHAAARVQSDTWTSQRAASQTDDVLVLATAATVQSHAYRHALNALGLRAYEKACPLLVPLVEEGWINHPVTDEVLRIYLSESLDAAPATSTLLLGCTHYPLLEPAIRRTLESLGHRLVLIDAADATAVAAAALITENFPLRSTRGVSTCTFYASDSVQKFQRLGSSFLGQPVSEVKLVDLGG